MIGVMTNRSARRGTLRRSRPPTVPLAALTRSPASLITVSAGPIETLAAGGIPGFDDLAASWQTMAPLGWDVTDPAPVANAVNYLLSPLSRGITGEILHVDGGYHAMGAPVVA